MGNPPWGILPGGSFMGSPWGSQLLILFSGRPIGRQVQSGRSRHFTPEPLVSSRNEASQFMHFIVFAFLARDLSVARPLLKVDHKICFAGDPPHRGLHHHGVSPHGGPPMGIPWGIPPWGTPHGVPPMGDPPWGNSPWGILHGASPMRDHTMVGPPMGGTPWGNPLPQKNKIRKSNMKKPVMSRLLHVCLSFDNFVFFPGVRGAVRGTRSTGCRKHAVRGPCGPRFRLQPL